MSRPQPKYKQEDIVAIECRHAVYIPPPKGEVDDYHLVKEVIHTSDGSVYNNVKFIKNYQCTFYVTRPVARNHKQKKEGELLSNVQEYRSSATNLVRTAARALGDPGFYGGLRKLARSPYLYGADILSTARIKREYQDKFPGTNTPASVAMFDTETDVVHGTEAIIIGTLAFGPKIFTAISRSYLEGIGGDVIDRLHVLLHKYLSEYIEKRKIEWEVVIVDDDVEIVKQSLAKAHEWQPDFFAIWNMNFDIPKMLDSLKRGNIDPADVFSDPRVPQAYRFFEYVQGPNQKVTASGKVTPIKPAAQWHTVYCPASFYVIDAMCAYRHVRIGTPEDPSYALDAVLNTVFEGKVSKLKFEEANGYTGLKWHLIMQTQYKLEYIIYNAFDCVSMQELNEKTRDLDVSLPMMAGCSDYKDFKSQPRRLVDAMHYHYLAQDPPQVFATTSDQMKTELDSLTIGLDGWICMLPAHLVDDNGLKIIEESPWISTKVYTDVGD